MASAIVSVDFSWGLGGGEGLLFICLYECVSAFCNFYHRVVHPGNGTFHTTMLPSPLTSSTLVTSPMTLRETQNP